MPGVKGVDPVTRLISAGEAATQKGCSKKSVRRACEQGKINSDYDPITGEYAVHEDEKWQEWRPGASG